MSMGLEKRVKELEDQVKHLSETLIMVMVGCGTWTKEEATKIIGKRSSKDITTYTDDAVSYKKYNKENS